MRRPTTVLVPAEVAIAYTAARGWHLLARPPQWWLSERDAANDEPADVVRPERHLRVVSGPHDVRAHPPVKASACRQRRKWRRLAA